MAAQLEEVESTQTQARSMKEVDDAVKESCDEEALSAKKQVINQMKELTDKYKKLDTRPVESNNIKFYSSKVQLPQFSQLIEGDLSNSEILYSSGYTREGGQPQFKIITKDIKGHSCSLGGGQVSVQVKWSTGEVTTAQVRDNDDGSYTTSFVAKQAGEVKLLVCIEGEQIKASPYTVVIHKPYTAIDQPSKVINNNGQMGKPWGIAFGRDGMWAVADHSKHCIYVFDSEDQLIRQFGCNGKHLASSVVLLVLHLIVTITFMWLIVITTGYRSLMLIATTCCSLVLREKLTVNLTDYTASQYTVIGCM